MKPSFFEFERTNIIFEQKEKCFYAILNLFGIKSQEEVITLFDHKTISYEQILEAIRNA